jgi:hypothetical protein
MGRLCGPNVLARLQHIQPLVCDAVLAEVHLLSARGGHRVFDDVVRGRACGSAAGGEPRVGRQAALGCRRKMEK